MRASWALLLICTLSAGFVPSAPRTLSAGLRSTPRVLARHVRRRLFAASRPDDDDAASERVREIVAELAFLETDASQIRPTVTRSLRVELKRELKRELFEVKRQRERDERSAKRKAKEAAAEERRSARIAAKEERRLAREIAKEERRFARISAANDAEESGRRKREREREERRAKWAERQANFYDKVGEAEDRRLAQMSAKQQAAAAAEESRRQRAAQEEARKLEEAEALREKLRLSPAQLAVREEVQKKDAERLERATTISARIARGAGKVLSVSGRAVFAVKVLGRTVWDISRDIKAKSAARRAGSPQIAVEKAAAAAPAAAAQADEKVKALEQKLADLDRKLSDAPPATQTAEAAAKAETEAAAKTKAEAEAAAKAEAAIEAAAEAQAAARAEAESEAAAKVKALEQRLAALDKQLSDEPATAQTAEVASRAKPESKAVPKATPGDYLSAVGSAQERVAKVKALEQKLADLDRQLGDLEETEAKELVDA